MHTEIAIKNILVIRFSLRKGKKSRRTFLNDQNRNKWFEYRSNLFFHTLYPAIEAQSKKPDRVFLLMDESDELLYKKFFSASFIEPIFSVKGNHYEQIAEKLISEGYRVNVAMTRIDSDDIVEIKFFEKINAQMRTLINDRINFDYLVPNIGYRTNLVVIQKYCYKISPFITRFWKSYQGEGSVYDISHVNIRSENIIDNYDAEWMQIIHGSNVANSFQTPTTKKIPPITELIDVDSTTVAAKENIDKVWFESWAGFPAPDEKKLFGFTLVTRWNKIRIIWRKIKGKS